MLFYTIDGKRLYRVTTITWRYICMLFFFKRDDFVRHDENEYIIRLRSQIFVYLYYKLRGLSHTPPPPPYPTLICTCDKSVGVRTGRVSTRADVAFFNINTTASGRGRKEGSTHGRRRRFRGFVPPSFRRPFSVSPDEATVASGD